MSETLCPFGDGSHKKKVWQGDGRSGFACDRCKKTWEWVGQELIATYDLAALNPTGEEG